MGFFDWFTEKPAAKPKSKSTGGTPPPNNAPSAGPAPTDKDFSKPSYALRNSQISTKSHLPVLTDISDEIGIQRNLKKQFFRNDEAEGVDRFLARVLRVENAGTEQEGESTLFGWADSLLSLFSDDDTGEAPAPMVEIVALTDCDIHSLAWGITGVANSDFSLPNEEGLGGSHLLIDEIRDNFSALFIATDSSVGVPQPGEYVWVSWKDLPNRKDGIYLGPLYPDPSPTDDRVTKDPCDKLTSEAPGGGSTYGSNEATISNNWGANLRKRIDAKIEKGQHPVGKGVFTGYPDINVHKVETAAQATLNWVCYTGIRQKADGSPEKELDITAARKFADKYHKKGIRTYVMGYPYRGQEEKFISTITSIATDAGAIGVIINLDNYYDGMNESSLSESSLGGYALEKYLSVTLKEHAKKGGHCIGLTATNIINRKNVPWKIFSDNKHGVDFCIPQILVQSYSAKRDAVLTKEEETEVGGQQGPTLGRATSFDNITPKNYKSAAQQITVAAAADYTDLASFKEKWYGRGLKKRGGDFDIRTLFTMGACQVIEEYWRSMSGYEDAKLKVSSHYRGEGKGNHSTGGAMDIRIEYNNGSKRIPVLQTWGGLKKLISARRIPNGAAGIYLNVSENGVKGVDPSKAGKASSIHAGPGGSAAVHYDMRSFTYSQAGKSKNTIWIWLDLDGNGKDEITAGAKARSWLNSNNLSNVKNYLSKANGTWISDKFTPHVTGEVRNMKQVLGLKGGSPMLPTTSGELLFLKQFEAWKLLGFKNIIPGLGTLGNSPKTAGWGPDGYNTPEKSPWRMRQDATWTFTSTRQSIHKVMADAIIWWDWKNTDVHHTDWPEKRWDIIRELGNATAAAEKLSSLKKSSMSETEKEKIKKLQLGEYLRHSPSPGEKLEAKKDAAIEAPPSIPKAKVPSETETTEPPDTTGLTAAQKKEIQESIDAKTKTLKTKQGELQALKDALASAQTSGTQDQKDKVISDLKKKEKEIKSETDEIIALKAKLRKEKAAESTPESTTGSTSAGTETTASTDPCANTGQQGGGSGGRRTASTGLPTGVVKESKLPGVDFVDFGFQTYARKSTNFLIIHNPAGFSGNHQKVAKTLLAKNYGVHFTVEPSGKQRQHVDLELGCSHAIPENYSSIGIEACVKSRKITPSPEFRPGPRGFYESVYSLCRKIIKATSIPMTVPHANLTKGEFFFGNNASAWGGSPNLKPGILAHGSWHPNRSDGRMETLYIALRLNGNSPGSAYKMARKAHDDQSKKKKSEGKYKWARVIGLKKGEANTEVEWTAPLTKKQKEEVAAVGLDAQTAKMKKILADAAAAKK